jgi:hypothetical protein
VIAKEDLIDGMLVRAKRPKRNMHKEFSVWQNGVEHWIRFKPGVGQIIGYWDTAQLVRYLNRYDFEIIGKYELKIFNPTPIIESKLESFKFHGAL